MEKSLLELLQDEKYCFRGVEFVKSDLEYIEKYIQEEKESENPVERYMEYLEEKRKERAETLREREEKLLTVRKELKQYIDFLNGLQKVGIKMKIKEIKNIDSNKVYGLCIKSNWYTSGTNKDYANMLQMCEKENISTEDLFKIAQDIFKHTDIKYAMQGCSPEYSDEENILNMMIYLNDCCYVYYEIEKQYQEQLEGRYENYLSFIVFLRHKN